MNLRFCSKTQWQMFLLLSGRHVGAPTWRLHTNLYKFGENVPPHIFHKKNCCDLNRGESLCISTFFLFPNSGLNLLNCFNFFILFGSISNSVTMKTSNNVVQNSASWPPIKLTRWVTQQQKIPNHPTNRTKNPPYRYWKKSSQRKHLRGAETTGAVLQSLCRTTITIATWHIRL